MNDTATKHCELELLGDDNVSIAWKNIQFEGSSLLGRRKIILRRLTGFCRYQTVNGFLGPSGAGKTTLLNCLNGKYRNGMSDDSSIYLNQSECDQPIIRFIEQHAHETMFPQMTVRQTLTYAFLFKNHLKNLKLMKKQIGMVLQQLLLDQSILDRRLEKCSGGEWKRISIAQELMSLEQPSFLFVDEPTTGLDSHSAFTLMKCLRHLADNNRMTILVSIHAPNSDIMDLLDNLYIIAKGGVCIYSGSPNFLRANLKERINLEFDEHKPPIEEYLRIACNGLEDKQVHQLSEWTACEENKKLESTLDKLKFLPNGIRIPFKRFSMFDLLLNFARMFNLIFVNDFKKFCLTLLSYGILFVIFALRFDPSIIYYNNCKSLMDNIETNETCFSFVFGSISSNNYISYQSYTMVFIGIPITSLSSVLFIPLLKVFHNEHRNRWYSLATFYWPVAVIHLINLIIVGLYITILFYFIRDHSYVDNGQFNWTRFASFSLFICMFLIYMQSVGHFISLVFNNNIEIAIIVSEVFYIIAHIYDGYLFQVKNFKDPISIFISDALSIKTISYGMLYSFYGLGRCQSETEISSILLEFEIDPDTVYTNLWRVVLIIVMIRLATILLMFCKFSWTSINNINFTIKFKLIDNENASSQMIKSDHIKRIKTENQLQFEQFSKDKFIIGWRTLTLFADNSIHEIRFAKDIDNNSKLILRNLNGQFRFGTMNALMGTSGAGKTSLLKVLNGRMKTKLSSESEFYLSKFTPIRTCYITQEVSGHLMPGLTVRQSLIYASRLKNAMLDKQIKHESVAEIIMKELDMAETGDTLVTKCSGGERKRLALGLELTAFLMPNLICIDEPTSGLDSNTAELVIGCLARLVKNHNLTIVASIHQPNTEILMMFDQVYILARGGVCIYSGHPSNIHQHLSQVFTDSSKESDYFPVEELIKYSCMRHTDGPVQTLVKCATEQILKEGHRLNDETQLVFDGIPLNRTRFSWKSIRPLTERYLFYLKGFEWFTQLFFIVGTIFFAFAMIFINEKDISLSKGCFNLEEEYNATCSEDRFVEKSNLRSNMLYIYYTNNTLLIIILMESAITLFFQNLSLEIEHRNGWYSIGVFYLAKSTLDILPKIPMLFLYEYIVDNTYSFRPEIYYWMVFILLLSLFVVQALGHLCAILVKDNLTVLSFIISGSFVFFATICSTPFQQLHYVYQCITLINPFRYLNEAHLILQYGFNRCPPKHFSILLFIYSLENDGYFYECIVRTIILAIFYRCLAFGMLLIKFNPYQNRKQRANRLLNNNQINQQFNLYETAIPGLTCHQDFNIKLIQI